MAYPVFASDSGSLSTSLGGNTLNVAYPATVNADEVLYMLVGHKETGAWNEPSGWNQIYTGSDGGIEGSFYWKRAAGTESGNQAVTCGGSPTGVLWGCMYRFTGVITTGTPHDSLALEYGGSTNVDIAEVESRGSKRLCANFALIRNSNNSNDDAANYSSASEYLTGVGSDAAIHLFTYQQAGSDDVPADVYTLPTARNFQCHVVTIRAPFADDVNGVSNANIGKINGVAKASAAIVAGS